MTSSSRRVRGAHLAALCAIALPAFAATAADAAPVKVYVARGQAVSLPAAAGAESVYDAGEDLGVGCGKGGAPLAAGWTGAGGPVSRVRPLIGDADETFVVETRRPLAKAKTQALAICASGAVKPTLAEKSGQQVSCGAKLALGVAASTTWPYLEEPVTAKPVGTHAWRMSAGSLARATAICVSPRAFSKVTTVSASRAFAVGAKSATASATCNGGRRPIGWGYEAPTMAENGWSSADTDSKLTVPFVAASQPAGGSGWSVTFVTPDQKGARSAAKVTAHVICAVPASSASAASSAPVATAAKLRPPVAKVENCRRLKGSAQRSCRARNAANKLVLKKLLDTRLVGYRADGAAVDWSFCRSGLWLSAITSDGSTGRSRDNGWQVEDAVVRQGGDGSTRS